MIQRRSVTSVVLKVGVRGLSGFLEGVPKGPLLCLESVQKEPNGPVPH